MWFIIHERTQRVIHVCSQKNIRRSRHAESLICKISVGGRKGFLSALDKFPEHFEGQLHVVANDEVCHILDGIKQRQRGWRVSSLTTRTQLSLSVVHIPDSAVLVNYKRVELATY